MSKGFLGFIGGLAAGAVLTMAYIHREVITAAIKGDELPEAPKGCPFSKDDEVNEEFEEAIEAE